MGMLESTIASTSWMENNVMRMRAKPCTIALTIQIMMPRGAVTSALYVPSTI